MNRKKGAADKRSARNQSIRDSRILGRGGYLAFMDSMYTVRMKHTKNRSTVYSCFCHISITSLPGE